MSASCLGTLVSKDLAGMLYSPDLISCITLPYNFTFQPKDTQLCSNISFYKRFPYTEKLEVTEIHYITRHFSSSIFPMLLFCTFISSLNLSNFNFQPLDLSGCIYMYTLLYSRLICCTVGAST